MYIQYVIENIFRIFFGVECVPHCGLLVPVQGVSYELYATVDHVGDLRGGHYTATIQSPDDGGCWYDFNDSRVTPVSLASLWQTLAIV